MYGKLIKYKWQNKLSHEINETKLKLIFLFTSLLFFLPSAVFPQRTIIESDSLILLDFYSATNGGSWTNNSGWLTDERAVSWYGVSLDPNDKTLRYLIFVSNNLIGSLPPSIGDLQKPEILAFNNNQLFDPIPVSLGKLISLKRLELRQNQLSDLIPESLGNLINLEFLDL